MNQNLQVLAAFLDKANKEGVFSLEESGVVIRTVNALQQEINELTPQEGPEAKPKAASKKS